MRQVAVCEDAGTGLRAVVAVDDVTLGPGLGGVRWRPYPDLDAATGEARRLARVMTLKHACADLPYGGAKSVLLQDGPAPATGEARTAQLLAFGRFVAGLGGVYVPGVDMGTSVDDLAVVGTVAGDVSCDRADPSPSTALGVYAGIGAALAAIDRDLAGAHVVVQGVGHVGRDLAERLAAAGARVTVADADGHRAATVARRVGGDVVAPSEACSVACDVLAPCATARVVDQAVARRLRCRVVAGGANDVLASREVATTLAGRGIVYVPDFVANAGGVVHIHATRSAWGADKLEASLSAIGDRVSSILDRARATGRTPLAVAEAMAADRLGHPVALPA